MLQFYTSVIEAKIKPCGIKYEEKLNFLCKINIIYIIDYRNRLFEFRKTNALNLKIIYDFFKYDMTVTSNVSRRPLVKFLEETIFWHSYFPIY